MRVKARGQVDAPHLPRQTDEAVGASAAEPRTHQVASSGAGGELIWHDTSVYLRERLAPGAVLTGPAIVAQYDTTSVLPPGWSATVDPAGAIVARQSHPTTGAE